METSDFRSFPEMENIGNSGVSGNQITSKYTYLGNSPEFRVVLESCERILTMRDSVRHAGIAEGRRELASNLCWQYQGAVKAGENEAGHRVRAQQLTQARRTSRVRIIQTIVYHCRSHHAYCHRPIPVSILSFAICLHYSLLQVSLSYQF